MRAATFNLAFALLFVSLSASLFSSPAQAQNDQQQPIPVPKLDPGTLGQPGFQFARGVPAVVNLIPHGNGSRSGHVWIGNTGQSIRIVGEVDGKAPDWPTNSASVLSKDHIEVWLAGPADVDLPPIGWGEDKIKAAIDLRTADDCEGMAANSDGQVTEKSCRDWFATQQRYRPIFQRLFVRQWLLTDKNSVEAYATPTYAAAAKYAGDNLATLKPHGDVRFRWQQRSGQPGYTFEIDIPYESFPPLNALRVSELRIMVDVFSAAPSGRKEGPFSTTSAARAYGRPETFNIARLDPPLSFEVTPCHSKLEGTGVDLGGYPSSSGLLRPAWFIPTGPPGTFQNDVFLVANESGRYLQDGEQAADLLGHNSPAVLPIHYFWRVVGPDQFVCGPDLAYWNGSARRDFQQNLTMYEDGAQGGRNIAEDGFEARRDPSGRILIKLGPKVWAPGTKVQCGACPIVDLKILAVDSSLNLITLLNIRDVIGGGEEPTSADFTISPDWSKIVEYDQAEDADHDWSSVTYCLGAIGYTVCDRKNGVEPPNPRSIKIPGQN